MGGFYLEYININLYTQTYKRTSVDATKWQRLPSSAFNRF